MAQRKIALLIDGSPSSDRALTQVLKLKRKTDSLHIIHAVERVAPVSVGMIGMIGVADPTIFDDINAKQRDAAKAVVHKFAEKCAEEKVEHVHAIVLEDEEGDSKNAVIDYIDTHGVELVVVGSRGLGAVKRFVLGSFSNYVVHHVKCSVVVVH